MWALNAFIQRRERKETNQHIHWHLWIETLNEKQTYHSKFANSPFNHCELYGTKKQIFFPLLLLLRLLLLLLPYFLYSSSVVRFQLFLTLRNQLHEHPHTITSICFHFYRFVCFAFLPYFSVLLSVFWASAFKYTRKSLDANIGTDSHQYQHPIVDVIASTTQCSSVLSHNTQQHITLISVNKTAHSVNVYFPHNIHGSAFCCFFFLHFHSVLSYMSW